MPTFERLPRFDADLRKLTDDQRRRFRHIVAGQFIPDLAAGKFRPGLRVKGVQEERGVFEMSWASDGRATFSYGDEQQPGEPHVIWRRVGTHDIFRQP